LNPRWEELLAVEERQDLGTLLLTDKRSRLRAIFDLELRRAAHAEAILMFFGVLR
jgi:hypothetical protein